MTFDTRRAPQSTLTLNFEEMIHASRIRSELYTSDAVYREELDCIFYGGWVFVGHESEIPERGCYVTRVVGQRSVVLLRDDGGTVQVFTNRCTHRGNLLAVKERGKTSALTCLYHGWTFDLTGNLSAMLFRQGATCDPATLGLERPRRVESYRGFVFANYGASAQTLAEHLGRATELIDRTCDLAPTGRISLTAGWTKHRIRSNWKMLAENTVDGYHAVIVHSSFFKAFRSHYDEIMVNEEKRKTRARDWGNGHVELDYSPTYSRPLEWFGTDEVKSAEYVKQISDRYGAQEGRRKLVVGPSHAYIFPNLFLGEMSILMLQPLSADETVQWHTPVLLDGAPAEINARSISQSAAAIGPSAFLIPEDAVISERQQIAMRESAGWLELSRGLSREAPENGVMSGNHTDETTQRGFWRHYRTVMGKRRQPE